MNASFSVSHRVQRGLGSACSAEQQLGAGPEAAGAGQVGGAAAAVPMMLFKFYSCHLESQLVFF